MVIAVINADERPVVKFCTSSQVFACCSTPADGALPKIVGGLLVFDVCGEKDLNFARFEKNLLQSENRKCVAHL
jgi:hypothetical protein